MSFCNIHNNNILKLFYLVIEIEKNICYYIKANAGDILKRLKRRPC